MPQEASAKAQFAINILIRNLFERTADIGFLCCDEDIRAFLRSSPATGEHSGGLAALRHRFDEYVRKYSVYADVILLDPSGNVLARLKEGKNPIASADPIVRQAIQTEAAYAERFGESDLFPDAKNAQIFAFRVADESGSVLGVLCLVFRFDDEMELIFSKLLAADD